MSTTVKMLSTRQARDRWFKIMDRKKCGLIDKGDLINYAAKLDLTTDRASEIFDRLDSDKDGFLNASEWDRSGVLLAYEGLVRAENHPMFVAYFKMQKLGVIPRPRLLEIMESKGLDSEILSKPDEMLPLGLGQSSKKPAPAERMPLLEPDSRHLVPPGPTYRNGPDVMDLPPKPFKPAYIRPRPRLPHESPLELPIQPLKWASLAMNAIDEDRPGTLRHGMANDLFDINATIIGGKLGSPFSIGPVFSFYTESQFSDEKRDTIERIRTIVKNEGRYRLPKEMELIEQMATRHARHNGGTDATPTCLFDHVETGDNLLHVAGRAFSPEVGLLLIEKGIELESFNHINQSIFVIWIEALRKFATVPITTQSSVTPGISKYNSRYNSRSNSRFASGANSIINSARGGGTVALSGNGGGGGVGGEEENMGKVDRRWYSRKRQGRLKLGCLIKMVKAAIKKLSDSLEIIARIMEGRLSFVEISGGELEPWESKRLKAKGTVVKLLEEAHELLELAYHTNPEQVVEQVIEEEKSRIGNYRNSSSRNGTVSSAEVAALLLADSPRSDNGNS